MKLFGDRVWFFLLGPAVLDFFVFILSVWLGYVATGSYERWWEVAYVFRSLLWLTIVWVFFYFLFRELRFEGKSLKNVVGISRGSLLIDAMLGLGILLLQLLLWNIYTVPWAFVWPEFPVYFEAMPLTITYVTLVIASSITAGFVEELIWRGYGVSKLEEKYHSTKKAVMLSSITWAVYHIDPFHIGIVLIFGIMYGYLFARVRRLAPLIIGHTAFDIIGFAFPPILTILVP